MQTQEAKEYSDIVSEFEKSFPGIQPPAPTWIVKWLIQYGFQAVIDAIQILQNHPLKARFTTDSTGRAISALLRQYALQRAIARTPKAGSRP
jgi:hypothetical protein